MRPATSPFPRVRIQRLLNSITDGPFGSSLTSSHYADEGARVVRLGNVGSARFINHGAAYIPLDYFHGLRQHEVLPGDLIVAGLGDEGHPVGRACVAPANLGPAIVKADCFRLRLDETRLTHRFAAWALSSSVVTEEVSTFTRGSTRTRINLQVVREIALPVPRVEEQQRIADFLDAETARIDRLREMRDTQRKLLEMRELSLIMATFSPEGVNKHRGRPTPWAWLPTVPEDWGVGYVGAYYSTRLGKMLNPDRTAGSNQAPYLRNANVHWYEIDTGDMATMAFEPGELARYSVLRGDLLVCEGGAGVAEAAVWDGRIEKCYFQKSLHRIRATRNVPVEWLMYWLRLLKHVGTFDAEGNLSTIPHLTGEQLRVLRLPIPPDPYPRVRALSERIKEAAEVRGVLRRADGVLQERRQALITAAVTGQFDVTTGRGADLS